MMELILKTIIGPIVVGVVLRLVDKWLNKNKQCQKRPQAYLDVSLGSFLVHDIELILNSSPLSHSSQNLSKLYILFNHCTTKRSRLSESYRKMIFRIVPKSLNQSQKTPPDWVELREIIMKKKSLGYLLQQVRRSSCNCLQYTRPILNKS